MLKISRRLAVPLALGILACGESTAPRVDPTACSSANGDPTFGCARVDARLMYNGGRATGIGPNVFLYHVADTARYRLMVSGPDSAGRAMIEVRRRHSESIDTGTVVLLAEGPPRSGPGPAEFLCSALMAHLHFSAVGAVPDTLRVDWTLGTLAMTGDQCAAVVVPTSAPDER